MDKKLINILQEEILEFRHNDIRDGPVKAYAIGKRYGSGIDPKEVRPTNQDAVEFMKLIDDGIKFYGFSTSMLHQLRVYLTRKGLYQ